MVFTRSCWEFKCLQMQTKNILAKKISHKHIDMVKSTHILSFGYILTSVQNSIRSEILERLCTDPSLCSFYIVTFCIITTCKRNNSSNTDLAKNMFFPPLLYKCFYWMNQAGFFFFIIIIIFNEIMLKKIL